MAISNFEEEMKTANSIGIIGTGKMGPIATKLRELYQQVVHGKLAKYKHWNTPVYPA